MHGGEPLLQFPLVKEITEFTVKEASGNQYMNFSIQTNGTLFNKEIIDFLEKYNYSVGISLDGMSENANTHRTTKSKNTPLAIYNINLKEYGGFLRNQTGIVCTLTKTNIAEIPQFILWLQDQGIKAITLSPLTIAGKGTQMTHEQITTEEYLKLINTLINMAKNKKVEENINRYY